MRRFKVAEDSMQPALQSGDIVFALLDRQPNPGSVVVFRHPNETDRWLIKRATACDGAEAWVESDNPSVTMADSRTLGWIPTNGMYRALVRFRRPFSWVRL